MRISDWSSDVCSSDLRGFRVQLLPPRQRRAERRDRSMSLPPLRLCARNPHHLLFLAAEAQFGGTEQAVDDIIAAGHAIIDELGLPAQIGRASCRERVCQYV